MNSIASKFYRTLCGMVAMLVILAGIASVPAFAADNGIYIATATPHYKHPETGVIEDAGGDGSATLGQSMTESATYTKALVEVDPDGNTYVTIRLQLMDNIQNPKFQVDGKSVSVDIMQENYGETSVECTADFRMKVKDEDSVIRINMYVVAMGREVIFYVTVSNLQKGSGDFITSVKVTQPQTTTTTKPAETTTKKATTTTTTKKSTTTQKVTTTKKAKTTTTQKATTTKKAAATTTEKVTTTKKATTTAAKKATTTKKAAAATTKKVTAVKVTTTKALTTKKAAVSTVKANKAGTTAVTTTAATEAATVIVDTTAVTTAAETESTVRAAMQEYDENGNLVESTAESVEEQKENKISGGVIAGIAVAVAAIAAGAVYIVKKKKK